MKHTPQPEIQLCRAMAMHDPYGHSLRGLFAKRNYMHALICSSSGVRRRRIAQPK
ncbi:hypothetical protein [Bradyrhizobium roseum]|uniref:hypothetical protein n=1 Tax=Bradyrhizobium roseum TaxID=3056648 RepID=UPI002612ED36|nr:hypothetical protein [Bradyrhizobium roseus]WKA26474.1 hypothetical protein QUH67_23100 [Bradyrhizobium roseus]